MPVTVEISSSDAVSQDDDSVPPISQLQTWANQACLNDTEVVVSFQLLGRDEMRQLNNDYRGKDEPTNVLSFPMQLPEQVEINLLGDLALCVDVINEEAEQQSKPRESHWAHMIIHGMLHLQGYDHEKDEEAKEMEALEIALLNRLNIDNPYEVSA